MTRERHVTRSPRQCNVREGPDQRLFELSPHALDDLISLFPGHRRLVVPMFDQCCEDVRNRQDSNEIGDACGAQAIGIAAAIEIFVMMPDGSENLRRNSRIRLQRFIAGGGVGLDQRAFPR